MENPDLLLNQPLQRTALRAAAERLVRWTDTAERQGSMADKKKFGIPGERIVAIAPGRGSCLASDMILCEGEAVGYMYREPPDSDHDSGWRFFSGLEDEDYTQNADNFGVYDVNTVANYDRSIVPLLDAPVGSAFEQDEKGRLAAAPFPDEAEEG